MVQTISALLLCCFIVLTIISADEKTAGDVSRASAERPSGFRGMSHVGSGDLGLTCLFFFLLLFLTEVPGSGASQGEHEGRVVQMQGEWIFFVLSQDDLTRR